MTEFFIGVAVTALTILSIIAALAICADHVIRHLFDWGHPND